MDHAPLALGACRLHLKRTARARLTGEGRLVSEVVIRFGVGDGVTRRAATWKCWARRGVGKNDIYLACRELRGALKTSLHETGRWHVAFDAQYLSAHGGAHERPTRMIEAWDRPSELVPGLTVAHRIVTPSGTVSAHVENPANDVVWLPPPPDGKAVETDILITAPGVRTTSCPGQARMGTQLVGSFTLDSGDTVWVVYHVVKLPSAGVTLTASNVRYFAGKTWDDIRGGGVRAILFSSEPDGSRVMYEAVLAEDHCDEPDRLRN
jgi:hypothetical protein